MTATVDLANPQVPADLDGLAPADPTLALGVPPGQPFWNYGDPHMIGGFWWLVTGAQYPTHDVFVSMLDP